MDQASTRRLLTRPAAEIARRLLGSSLTSTVDGIRVEVRVTEVEAYGGVGEDPGSHAFRRQTARNAAMFGPPGRSYVYFTYGMHWCLNVVTCPAGTAGAILIRAGEVVGGLDAARGRRPRARQDVDLARGPARLTRALGITGAMDGVDLLDRGSPVQLRLPALPAPAVAITGRTGVAGPGALTPWRFAADHPTVSPYRPASPRARG
ncbi:MAG: DNA-3-methyladenine glycosylase [Actinomycetales bacterium]|nr:DNA-3-methyladenine glycosylase [Actinomycetales bacterium]